MTALLELRGIVKTFRVGDHALRAVDGVSLSVAAGETLALVGESGSGKTTLARAALLLTPPDAGSVRFDGEELTGLPSRRLKPVRRRMQMVFQDPFGSLNPRLPVATILGEPFAIHGIGSGRERRRRTADLLAAVGLPEDALNRYPHEFSGGQRQRIAIARALALDPDLIVADEPVSALDVSIQSQILNLLMDLKDRHGLSYLFIGHDLAVVDHVADRVAVMYLGRVVEIGSRAAVLTRPSHPYTRALIDAVPVPGRGKRAARPPAGDPPSPLAPPPGCPYHPRCPRAEAVCRAERPELRPVRDGGAAACHFAE